MQVKQMLSVAAVGLCCSLAAQAQTQAPGLWEHSMKMKSADGRMEAAMAEMQKQRAAMPPEQRKQMEAAMARSGMPMGGDGGGPTTTKVCLTPEEAAKPPEARMARGNCVQKDVQRSGNTIKFKMECTEPPMTGEGEMSFSDKAYSGKSVISSMRGGKSQQMTMEMSGKWLSADCGDVKPRVRPPAARASGG